MDKQFDELSKSLAEGVSRREALKKFGIGLVSVLLATVGLSRRANAEACKDRCRQLCHQRCGSSKNDCFTFCYSGCVFTGCF